MKRIVKGLGVVLVALALSGCSILDPADRQALRDQIAAMTADSFLALKHAIMGAKAENWLKGRPEEDQMGKLQCRTMEGGVWGEWKDEEGSFTVKEMKACLERVWLPATYLTCMEEWEGGAFSEAREKFMSSSQGEDLDCKYVWDFRYDPEKLPAELTNPDVVSVDDIIDTLIALPAPPPGWAFPELVPLLCPLGAGQGWGCPDKPGQEQTPPPGGGG